MNPWDTPKLRVPIFFKLWFALCAVLGIGMAGFLVWGGVKLVNHFTK